MDCAHIARPLARSAVQVLPPGAAPMAPISAMYPPEGRKAVERSRSRRISLWSQLDSISLLGKG